MRMNLTYNEEGMEEGIMKDPKVLYAFLARLLSQKLEIHQEKLSIAIIILTVVEVRPFKKNRRKGL